MALEKGTVLLESLFGKLQRAARSAEAVFADGTISDSERLTLAIAGLSFGGGVVDVLIRTRDVEAVKQMLQALRYGRWVVEEADLPPELQGS